MKEHYDRLGVSPGASEDEIKKAYRKLAMAKHPDKGGNEEEFKLINESYSILTGKQINRNAPPPAGPSGFGSINDIFDFINRQHGQGMGFKQAARPPSNDSEINLTLNVTVEDIKSGRTYGIEYHKSKPCADCGGVGGKEKETCSNCGGRGVVTQVQTQGNARYMTSFPCNICGGAGCSVKDPCKTCNAAGYVVYSEKLEFEMKEKK